MLLRILCCPIFLLQLCAIKNSLTNSWGYLLFIIQQGGDFIKRFLSCLVIFTLCFYNLAFASATPSVAVRQFGSRVATDSDASFDFELDPDFGISPYIIDVEYDPRNTVNRHFCSMGVWDSDSAHNYTVSLNSSNGQAFIDKDKALAAGLTDVERICLNIGRGALPPPGKYTLRVWFVSHTGLKYSRAEMYTRKTTTNASWISNSFRTSLYQFSGDAVTQTTIEIGSLSQITVSLYLQNKSLTNLPLGGYWHVAFDPITDDEPIIDVGAGGPSTPEGTQEEIASGIGNLGSIMEAVSGIVSDISSSVTNVVQNTGQIVNLQTRTNELIIEVVKTISNQLAAFWDQLAGEFTNLYNKMNDHHNELMDADRTNVEDHMENDDKNTDRIIDALESEHQDDQYGYNNDEWGNERDKIDGILNEYDAVEDELIGNVSGHLDSFEFDNYFSSFAFVMSDIGDFLSRFYDTLDTFNIPIGFSFTLTIAMLCIGWYRFKGGI